MLDIVIEARNAAISDTVKVKRILPFVFIEWMYYHTRIYRHFPVSYLFGGQVTHRDSGG